MGRVFAFFLAVFMAQPLVAEEYRIVTSTSSGGYFVHSRLIARHLQNKIEGSSVIVHVVPGAAGVVAMNYMSLVAKKDGTDIGHIDTRSFMPAVMNDPQVRYNLSHFHWLGASTDGRKIPTVLFARKDRPLIIGSESSVTLTPAKLVLKITNMSAREISGYSDAGSVRLAFERGEITGAIYNLNGAKTMTPHWLTDPSIDILLQIGSGSSRSLDLPDVPTIQEAAKNEETRKLAEFYEMLVSVNRPFILPTETPKAKVDVLRKIFTDILNDPFYIADASKIGVDVTPIYWEETQEIIRSLVNYPPEIVSQFRGS